MFQLGIATPHKNLDNYTIHGKPRARPQPYYAATIPQSAVPLSVPYDATGASTTW